MKTLHSLAFYALLTPAIALGSAALLAQENGNGNQDLGEQDMDHHAEPENQNSELHQESTKSKYNSDNATGRTDKTDPETGDQSSMPKKDDMESSQDNDMDE